MFDLGNSAASHEPRFRECAANDRQPIDFRGPVRRNPWFDADGNLAAPRVIDWPAYVAASPSARDKIYCIVEYIARIARAAGGVK